MNGWGVVEEEEEKIWMLCGGWSEKKKVADGLRDYERIWVFFNPTKPYCLS